MSPLSEVVGRNAEDRGIVYFLANLSYAERWVVSCWSLRHHWTGPVCVIAADDQAAALADRYKGTFRLSIQRRAPIKCRRNSAYVTKTMLPAWSPFRRNAFIDADTTVHGCIDRLFQPPVAVTQFADWQSQGRRVSKRISDWNKINKPGIRELVSQQLSRSYPAINTGVFAWHKGAEGLHDWHVIASLRAGQFIVDETAMQLLFPEIPGCEVLRDTYNWSPLFSKSTDPVIRHYHGGKHLRREQGAKHWRPLFNEVWKEDPVGFQSWAGHHDPQVRNYLHPKKPTEPCCN